jgi:hypothetical protein
MKIIPHLSEQILQPWGHVFEDTIVLQGLLGLQELGFRAAVSVFHVVRSESVSVAASRFPFVVEFRSLSKQVSCDSEDGWVSVLYQLQPDDNRLTAYNGRC